VVELSGAIATGAQVEACLGALVPGRVTGG
jgi:hypothetical protein